MFPLPIRVRIALGADLTANPSTWTWTDITAYARPRITITRGTPDESSQAPPMSCRLRLNNAGGRFVVRNPLGEWYPLLRRNTPLRVEVQVAGVWYTRSTTFIAELPTTFVPGSDDTYVDVVTSGITRRLGQGAAALLSAPRRYIMSTSPLAYWPLEDGQLAYQGWALAGGQSMRPFAGTHPSGAVITFAQWGRGDLAPWLPPTVSRSGNAGLTVIWSPVTMPATGRWVVDFMYRSGTDAGGSAVDVNPSYLSGGALGWPQLLLGPSFRGLDVAMNGESEVTATAATLYDGQPHHVRWDVTESGAKVAWTVYVDGVAVNSGTTSGDMTLPAIRTLALTAEAQNGAAMAQGHVAVWTSPPPVANAVDAAFGHAGESAANRMTRLCAEAGVPFVVAGSSSEAMGPQTPAPLLNLLREAEATDGGILFERTDGRLGYLRREERYNRPVGLALTYGQLAGSFAPTDDDRLVRNDVTVTRPGGSSAQAVDQAHIAAAGRYDDQVQVNALTDDVLADHAGWRVHLGTVDEMRYPQLTLNLGNARVDGAAVAAWLGSDVGSRMTVVDLPQGLGLPIIDQVVEGYDETIDRVEWSVGLHCSPAAPWDVATVDGEQRIAADGSGLAMGLGASGTSMLLLSTIDNGPWTEAAADFPVDIRVGGERVTASAISPAVVDTFTRSAASGWGTADSGQAWTTTGGSASDYSVSGGSARHLHTATGSLHHSFIAPGGSRNFTVMFDAQVPVMPATAGISVWAVVRGSGTGDYYAVQLLIAPGGDATIGWFKRVGGALSGIGSAFPAGTHTSGATWRIRAAVLGSSLHAKAWIPGLGEPDYQVIGSDSSISSGTDVGVLTRLESGNTNTLPVTLFVDNVTVINPQTVALSARGVNGIQRAWPAGTDVDVWAPAIVPL